MYTELVESVLISLDYIYHGLSFITNIIIVLVQCLMILFTVMVGVVWDTKNKKKNQKSGGNEEGKIHDSNDQLLKLLANVCTAHKRYLDEYETKLGIVRPIYKIFHSFFMFQLIIHLFSLFFHIAYLIRPWIRHGQVTEVGMLIENLQIYDNLHIIFEGLLS